MPDGTIELDVLPAPQTRAQLLDLLKKDFEYPGDDDLTKIKTFIIDNKHDLGDLDIDAIYKATVAPRVARFAAPTETPEQAALRIGGKSAGIARVTAGNVSTKASPMTAEQHDRIAGRKRYANKISKGAAAFTDPDIAEQWSATARLAMFGSKGYAQKRWDEDCLTKSSSTSINLTGGALVPGPELDRDLIELREKYGVYRAAVGTRPMSTDRLLFARNDVDAQVYWEGENQAGVPSDGQFSNPQATANKLLGLNLHPNEILNDAAISIADVTARSFARQAEYKIDNAGFNGTGASIYGGMVGIAGAFVNQGATVASRSGTVVGSTSSVLTLTSTDVATVVGKLPQYADGPDCAFYMSRYFYGVFAERLGRAVGGMQYDAFMGVKPAFTLYGYPVRVAQVMNKVNTTKFNVCYFGSLGMGAKLGQVRNSLAFDMSSDYAFNTDQVALRYRERTAILVHDIGNYTSTAANQVPGPIIALDLA